MSSITVLVPVLDRPHRVEPLIASLAASQVTVPLSIVFVASEGDDAEIAALDAAGARYEVVGTVADSGQWAKKINHAFAKLETDWALFAADDLDFRAGWAEEALRVAKRVRRCVIGTNDTVNARVKAGRHSTHTLVHRDYIECGTVDADGIVLHPEYGHWFVDDELIQTAQFRRQFAMARQAIVAHMHPAYQGAPDDETYRRGQATVMQDKALFDERKWMWGR